MPPHRALAKHSVSSTMNRGEIAPGQLPDGGPEGRQGFQSVGDFPRQIMNAHQRARGDSGGLSQAIEIFAGDRGEEPLASSSPKTFPFARVLWLSG
jgi:hypothetical protein